MQLKIAGVTAADGSLRDSGACVWFEVCWFDFLLDGKTWTIPHLYHFSFIQERLPVHLTCHQIKNNGSVRGLLWPAISSVSYIYINIIDFCEYKLLLKDCEIWGRLNKTPAKNILQVNRKPGNRWYSIVCVWKVIHKQGWPMVHHMTI